MDKFQFYIPTRVLFGKGSLEDLHASGIPGRKGLIVISSGRSTKANGYLRRVEEQLEKAGCEHVLYDKVLPNPVLRNVEEGAALAKEHNCDFVVGLGGGSSMDTAKAIAVMATNPGEYWDYNGGKTGKAKPLVCDPLPIIAITTTAGTGSEVNGATVTTKEDTNEKCAFKNEKVYPRIAVVDPDLMMTVPPRLTMYQGMDAFFHAAESVINITEHPVGEMFALKAIEYVARYLPTAVKDGSNEEARGYIALANSLASFFMKCTSEHAMEHALSAFHSDLQHGAGLMILSRAYHGHFIDKHACDEQYIKMAKAMGYDKADKPEMFLTALQNLYDACGLELPTMENYGITKEEIPAFVQNAKETCGVLFAVDPVQLSDEETAEIYRRSF